jgi:predicted SpoU family rRNA methylase
MADIRLTHNYFTADRIATHATATARQLFTADGKLIKAGN